MSFLPAVSLVISILAVVLTNAQDITISATFLFSLSMETEVPTDLVV